MQLFPVIYNICIYRAPGKERVSLHVLPDGVNLLTNLAEGLLTTMNHDLSDGTGSTLGFEWQLFSDSRALVDVELTFVIMVCTQ